MKASTLLLLAGASLAMANPMGCRPNYPPPPPPETQVTVYPTSPPATTEPPSGTSTPPPTPTSSRLTSSGANIFLATGYAVAPKAGGANTDGTQGEVLGKVQACGQALWISNSPPCAYCPDVVGAACPAGNVTSLAVSNGASMYVEVPGGQQMYLAPDKHVGFTQAHSAFIPTGSVLGPFKSLAVAGDVDGYFVFDDVQWLGCPSTGANADGLRLFAQVAGITDADVGGSLSSCRTVELRTEYWSGGPGAWQYT